MQMLFKLSTPQIPTHQRRTASRRVVMAQASAPASSATYNLVLKARSDRPSELGDCPFCHRVLLTMAYKGIPFERTLIDFKNKPQWLLDASQGKVPVLKQDSTNMIMPDSDKIVVFLEDNHPTPSMKSDTPPEVGAKLFPAFRGFLFAAAGSEEEATKRSELESELRALDAYLSQPGKGPLLGGEGLSMADAALAPKLYHARVALRHFKGFTFPEELKAVARYLDAVQALPAWRETDYGTDAIIAGWTTHLAQH